MKDAFVQVGNETLMFQLSKLAWVNKDFGK
jgi:hypothetical protein